jgi:glycosyltransferase involved in cell wall biosynthesis
LGNSNAVKKPTISIVMAIWGEGYAQCLPQWFAGLDTLEREYDEVVIVCDQANISAVLCAATDFSKLRIRVEEHTEFGGYWNRAIDLSTSKWIAFCCADDYFLPEALNEVDEADQLDANLILDNLIHKGTNVRQTAYWDQANVKTDFRLMGGNTITKRLWEAAGGFPTGFQFADWGFALRLAKTGLVKTYAASTNRIVYDVGYDRHTLSGASLSTQDRANGQSQIDNLAKELGL